MCYGLEASMPAADPALLFNRVEQRRSLDDIVEQIRESILTGALAPGDRLPNERDLCTNFGVSRPTLREALRVLEALGLVEIRRGRGGGIFAQEPGRELIGLALESLVRFSTASALDLVDFRLSFESENAAVAAQRRTDEDVETLREIARVYSHLSEGSRWQEMAAIDVEFHSAVATATQNQISIAIMLAIPPALRAAIRSIDSKLSPGYVELAAADHIEIAEAIGARDSDAARRVMLAHVTRWREEVEIASGVGDGRPRPVD
jgi:GntR family transcriptional repressor for pyruvate dehydrogenase complex